MAAFGNDEIALLEDMARSCGFETVGVCDASTLKALPEVRAMCAADKCHAYGHSWACPPACGDIASYQALFDKRSICLVVQSVGRLEDEFDFETMMDTERIQKERFFALCGKVRERYSDGVYLSAGTCTVCKPCTYPDEPCRFPEKRLTSMEAAGLVVSDVCVSANIPYNHGKNTIAYTSCIVL